MWGKGPFWGMYQRMTVTRPLTENRFGFPWTTRTVLARVTETQVGNPFILTLSAKGHDVVTAMGGRNLSLIAGGVADLTYSGWPGLPVIGHLSLPEPAASAQLAAGAIALLAIAGIRAVTSR